VATLGTDAPPESAMGRRSRVNACTVVPLPNSPCSKRRSGPGRRPTDEQVWEIVQTLAYDFEVFDPRYAEVILE